MSASSSYEPRELQTYLLFLLANDTKQQCHVCVGTIPIGFYGGENFMELFCIFPFVGELMMRGGEFDDEGTVHTMGIPGELQVSMVFSEEEDEDEPA